jgi:hypothetical protein
MATSGEVLEMLCLAGGWIIVGDTFEGITWTDERPRCTKAEFEAGFAQYDAWKSKQDAKAAADKATLLAKLGITADEAKLLLS